MHKNRLTIVEGPDLAGKSTYCDTIADADVNFHADPPKPEESMTSAYLWPLMPYVHTSKPVNILCDRWHLGEYVYPLVFGRTPLWRNATEVFDVTAVLAALFDLRIVVMLPKRHVITERYNKRGDELASLSQILHAYDQYGGLFPHLLRLRAGYNFSLERHV